MGIRLKNLDREMQKQLVRLPDGPGGTFDVLIHDWRPMTLNALLKLYHLRQSAAKHKDYETVAAELHRAGVTAATGKRRVSFVAVYGKGERMCDEDAYWKVLMDALEFCGALVKDSPKWVEQGNPGSERAERPAFRIVLEDI